MRPLGCLEEAWHLKSKWGSANTVRLVSVRGQLNAELVQDAFDHLVGKNALLRSVVCPDTHCLTIQPTTAFSGRIRHYAGGSTTIGNRLAEDCLNRRIDDTVGPLIQVHFLPGIRPDGPHELVLVIHHMISDGTCFTQLIHDFMLYCQSRLEHTPLPSRLNNRYADNLRPESVLSDGFTRRRWAKLPLRALGLIRSEVRYRPQPLPVLHPAQEVRTCMHRLLIDAALTEEIVVTCRREETTFQGALTAALLRAIRRHFKTMPLASRCVRYLSFVNMRKRTIPPTPEDQFGCCVSYTSHVHPLSRDVSFWTLARESKRELDRDMANHVPESHLYLNPTILKVMHRLGRTEMATFVISNLGRLPFEDQYGPLHVADIRTGVALDGIGAGLAVNCLTLNNRMSVDFSYLNTRFDAEGIASLSEFLREELTAAARSTLSSDPAQ